MCTSSGRKAASEGLTAQRRAPGRMVSKSKFVGGQAALYKQVSVSGDYMKGLYNQATRANDRMGAEAGGSTIDARAYGGTSRDTGGEANNTEVSFSGTPSLGVTGGTYTGASGRKYNINRSSISKYGSGETGGDVQSMTTTFGVGKRQPQGTVMDKSANTAGAPKRTFGVKNMSSPDEDPDRYKNWNVGAVKGGVDVGKTEEEARATYKDFGMDFDKDEYRGAFYKTEKGLANQQRSNVAGKEGARRKVNRIRNANKGGIGADRGNRRLKGKKQGNLRISSAGVQGGGTGGGTTLS